MSRITQYSRWVVGSVLLASALGIGVFGMASASRDVGFDSGYGSEDGRSEDHDSRERDADDDSGYRSGDGGRTALAGADPAAVVMYREECGACHVAYPPGLLPSASWRAIMNGLDDHFGENAELPADMTARLAGFLGDNASDRGDRLKNARLLRDVKTQAPLRITELPYFKQEHDEIPRRMVEDNPDVTSFSNCDACHQDAARGRFDEDTASIPGSGGWGD